MPNGIKPYEPSYDFAHFAKLNLPVNGDRLAAQLDALADFSQEILKFLDATLGGDGQLKSRKLDRTDLGPTLLAEIDANTKRQIEAALIEISLAVLSVQTVEQDAQDYFTKLNQDVGRALYACEQAVQSMEQAGFLAKKAAEFDAAIATKVTSVQNSENHARGSAEDARLSEEYAYMWAEYLAGPVVVAQNGDPVFNEAVSGGYWSAKWWALQAQKAVADTINWYLGPFDKPPTATNTGGPLLDGMMYYDKAFGQLFVWADGAWTVKLQPSVGVLGHWTYIASEGQTVFKGPDFFGQVPDWKGDGSWRILVNGVQLFHAPVGVLADYQIDEPSQVMTLKERARNGDIVTLEKVITAASFAGQLTTDQLQTVVDAITANISSLTDFVTKPQMMQLTQYLVDWFKPLSNNKAGAVLMLNRDGNAYQALPGDFIWAEPLEYLQFILSQSDAAEFVYQVLVGSSQGFNDLVQELTTAFLPTTNPAPKGTVDMANALINQLPLAGKTGVKGAVIRGYSPTVNDPAKAFLWDANGQLVGEILSTKTAYSQTQVDAAIADLKAEIITNVTTALTSIDNALNDLSARLAAIEPGPWKAINLSGAAANGNTNAQYRINQGFIEFRGNVYFYPSVPDNQTVTFGRLSGGGVNGPDRPTVSYASVAGGLDSTNSVNAFGFELLNGLGDLRIMTNGGACFRLTLDGVRVQK